MNDVVDWSQYQYIIFWDKKPGSDRYKALTHRVWSPDAYVFALQKHGVIQDADSKEW